MWNRNIEITGTLEIVQPNIVQLSAPIDNLCTRQKLWEKQLIWEDGLNYGLSFIAKWENKVMLIRNVHKVHF